ncbi:MAG: GNAT family N-acetyltransferase [Gammaproteobacteria bacterium]|nr:GNAT family N-acetyltransferase [Gammaproteobacteria bacterium]
MQWFALHAAYFRVAVGDDRLAAFLVGLRPGTSYESPNYRWFCDHYDDFAYVDRVAVADFARRAGLASRLYDDFAATLPDTVEFMTCEVNIRPPNESSMEFHRRMGFRQVGTQSTEGGNKEVAMLAKTL